MSAKSLSLWGLLALGAAAGTAAPALAEVTRFEVLSREAAALGGLTDEHTLGTQVQDRGHRRRLATQRDDLRLAPRRVRCRPTADDGGRVGRAEVDAEPVGARGAHEGRPLSGRRR